MYNIEDAYKKLKDGNLKSLTQARESEKETAVEKREHKSNIGGISWVTMKGRGRKGAREISKRQSRSKGTRDSDNA